MVLLRGLTRPCRCLAILEMRWGEGVAAQLEFPEDPSGFRESREVLRRAGGSARDRRDSVHCHGAGGTRPEWGSLAVPRGYVAAWIAWAGLGWAGGPMRRGRRDRALRWAGR